MRTLEVLGERKARPYREAAASNPADTSAESKWKADQALLEIASSAGLEMVTVRPPLGHWPCVEGSFLKLVRAIDEE